MNNWVVTLIGNIRASTYRVLAYIKTPFYNNVYSLLALQVSGAFLGLFFWLIAARILSPGQVGIGTALVSSTMLVLNFADLGLDDGLAYHLPLCEDKQSLVNAYFSLSVITSLLFALAIFLLQPSLFPALSALQNSLFLIFSFFIGALVLHLSAMQDALFVAQRVSKYAFLKGLLINFLRIPVLFALLALGEWSLLTSLILVTLIGLVLYGRIYVKKVDLIHHYRINLLPKVWLPIMRFSFGNYLTGMMVSLPGTIIPLLILNLLGANANGYFYIAWILASMLDMVGRSFGVSLFVEGRAIPESLNHNIIRSILYSSLILLPVVLILVLYAAPMLSLFGSEYRVESAVLVRILAIGGIPMTLYGIAVGVLKAHGRIQAIILIGFVFVSLHLGGSWCGARLAGTTGIAWAIVIARVLSAALAGYLLLRNPRIAS